MDKKKRRRKVFICSPFRPRGKTREERAADLESNRELARLGCEIAVKKGFLPLAPHLYFTQFLTDEDAAERETGIWLGMDWLSECNEIWVMGKRITEGMRREIEAAEAMGIPIVRVEIHSIPFDQFLKDLISGL